MPACHRLHAPRGLWSGAKKCAACSFGRRAEGLAALFCAARSGGDSGGSTFPPPASLERAFRFTGSVLTASVPIGIRCSPGLRLGFPSRGSAPRPVAALRTRAPVESVVKTWASLGACVLRLACFGCVARRGFQQLQFLTVLRSNWRTSAADKPPITKHPQTAT